MGDGAGQGSWPQSVKDLECHAKELEFDTAGTWEPLTEEYFTERIYRN